MRLKFAIVSTAILAIAGAYALNTEVGQSFCEFVIARLRGGYSVQDRLNQYGESARSRLEPSLKSAGLKYPPQEVALLAFKDSKRLEVYGRASTIDSWHFVKAYPIRGMSGQLGPKLFARDGQVPEGVYEAESLNPNSRFHLSIRLNYPNAFDREMAVADKRSQIGGDIMIHGTNLSSGCLAVGNTAVEELFALVALASKENTRIVISPTDFRQGEAPPMPERPKWIQELYGRLKNELKGYRHET